MKRLVGILGTALLAGGLGLSTAAQARPTDDESHELRELKGEVQTLRLLNRLHPSQDQVQKLYALAQQAAALRENYEQGLEAMKSEAMAQLSRTREELLRGQVNEGSDRQESRQVRKQFRSGRKELMAKMEPLAQQAQSLLTDEQRSVLREEIGKRGRHRGHGKGRHGAMDPILSRVRQADEQEYARLRQQILERHAKVLQRRGTDESELQSQQERLGAALDQARTLDEQTFEARKAELFEGLVPGRDGRDEARGEKHEGKAVVRWLSSEATLKALAEYRPSK